MRTSTATTDWARCTRRRQRRRTRDRRRGAPTFLFVLVHLSRFSSVVALDAVRGHRWSWNCALTATYAARYIRGMESSFAIIAEPSRRAILSLLASSERSVGDIEEQLRLSQPSVS